ncbi:MAG: family 10 glycosylhydrolase [Bacilli bacterium]|nr:family 10 glycosylhydrolase [Bacilli bacterium]
MNRKLLFLIISFFIISLLGGIIVKADEVVLTKTNSNDPVTYLGTDEKVMIDTEYVSKDTDFRAVWISTYIADVAAYKNKTQYQAEITSILDVMEYYNLNVMIFHVRVMNDALYTTSMSPISKYWKVDQTWDALEWVINECHKRGIEFHAWMNPYRVSNGAATINMDDLAAKFPQVNPASNVDNMLKGSSVVILNPAKAIVQNFLVNTCMEVVRKYDVDAIHFDDYFYTDGIGNQDNEDYVASKTSLSLADWRRENVDTFIYRLSTQIRAYNKQNNKAVQFGIAPSGVYRDGNGVVTYNENGDAVSSGSLTRQGGHYGDPLYSDTLKWVNEEWIDYICPQCYHGFETTQSSFHGKVAWWNKVVENKKVNLYIGIGLYMAGDKYWPNSEEFYHQMLFLSTQDNVNGIAIFSYKHLKAAYIDATSIKGIQVAPVLENCWNKKTILPTLKLNDSIILDEVTNLSIQKTNEGYNISFDKLDQAKFYAIYRSSSNVLQYTNDELIATIGGKDDNEYMTYSDIVADGEYLYGIKPLSINNNLGKEASASTDNLSHKVVFKDHNGNIISTVFVKDGTPALAPSLDFVPEGYSFVCWSSSIENITADLEVQAVILVNSQIYDVVFLDISGDEISRQQVKQGKDAQLPEPPIVLGYTFKGWSKEATNIRQDEIINAIYEINQYKVSFYVDDQLIDEAEVNYQSSVIAPEVPYKEGYRFIGWDRELNNITENMKINAIFEREKLIITYIDNDGNFIDSEEGYYGDFLSIIEAPKKEGYSFKGWYLDDILVTSPTIEISGNITIVANYIIDENSGCNQLSFTQIGGLLLLLMLLKKRRLI